MPTLLLSCLISLNLSTLVTEGPSWPAKRTPPTRLVHFDVGLLITATGKLRVNVDKQLGGQVYVQLLDQHGRAYFDRTLTARDEAIRLSLDLSRLPAQTYRLKITNGLEMITRDVVISPPTFVTTPAAVTLR